MSLNTAQRNALAIALRLLDERCDRMLALLAGDRRPQALHHVIIDLSGEQQAALSAQISQLRSEVADVAYTYQLASAPQSMWREIEALLVTSWVNLEDTRPAKLKRYGAVDPSVVAPLDTALAGLISCILAMRQLGAPDMTKGVAATDQ